MADAVGSSSIQGGDESIRECFWRAIKSCFFKASMIQFKLSIGPTPRFSVLPIISQTSFISICLTSISISRQFQHFFLRMGMLCSPRLLVQWLLHLKSPEDEISKIDIGILSESESGSSLNHGLKISHPIATRSKGHYFYLQDGRRILDACGGAGVACVGHGNRKILWAISCQSLTLTYVPWAFFDNLPTLKLWKRLEESTGGKLPAAYLTSSGMAALLLLYQTPYTC